MNYIYNFHISKLTLALKSILRIQGNFWKKHVAWDFNKAIALWKALCVAEAVYYGTTKTAENS